MNTTIRLFAVLAALLFATQTAQADLIWTGATTGGVNIFSSDYNGGAGSITSTVVIGDNVVYDSVNITADDNNAFNEFLLGDGFDLTISNSTFTTPASGGFNGPAAGGSAMNIINSTINLQYLATRLAVSMDGTSALTLRGGGDPINSQSGDMSITMDQGAQLTLASFAEFAEQGADIFAANASGQIVSFSTDSSILTFSGNTGTAAFSAVPEPGAMALLVGLTGMVGLVRRRRA